MKHKQACFFHPCLRWMKKNYNKQLLTGYNSFHPLYLICKCDFYLSSWYGISYWRRQDTQEKRLYSTVKHLSILKVYTKMDLRVMWYRKIPKGLTYSGMENQRWGTYQGKETDKYSQRWTCWCVLELSCCRSQVSWNWSSPKFLQKTGPKAHWEGPHLRV